MLPRPLRYYRHGLRQLCPQRARGAWSWRALAGACLALASVLLLVACTASPLPDQDAAPPLLDTAIRLESSALDELPPSASYRIGLQTEVTGDGAAIGDLTIRAARLAIEEINGTGGIHGVPLELVVRDVGSDPVRAVAEYRAAVTEDDLVALLGPFKSAYGVKIVPEHRDAALPMFIGATNSTLTAGENPLLFRMRPSDSVTAAAMVAFAADVLGARSFGVVHDTDAFGRGGADEVRRHLAIRGLAPAVEIGYATGSAALDRTAAELAATSVDVVLIYGTNGTDVGRLLRSIRYWDVSVPIITSPGGATVPAANIAAEAQDAIFVVTDAVLAETDAGARFVAAFKNRFGLAPDTYVTWTYDAVHLLAEVLREVPAATGAELGQRVRATTFRGAQGDYRFDARGDGLHAVTLVRMEAGMPQPLGVFADGQLTLNEEAAALAGLPEARP